MKKLYGYRCLRCEVERPLAVAHLASWPVVRADILAIGQSLADWGFWRFHQPANVVLLCCNCHALLDDPKETDVTVQDMFVLRDHLMANPRFGDAVRAFVCYEMGPTPRRVIGMNGLQPLLMWLRDMAMAGVLPPPYRFVVPDGAICWRVDLVEEDWEACEQRDLSLPLWNGRAFVTD